MRLNFTPYSYQNSYNSYPVFKSGAVSYANTVKGLYSGSNIYTTTCLLRKDLSFTDLAEYIKNAFSNDRIVNIISLAGSDGSEAYSLGIALREIIPENMYRKYFPIISIDKNEDMIRAGQSGRINLTGLDLKSLKELINPKIKYFSNPKAAIKIDNDCIKTSALKSYEVNPELFNSVRFRIGNLVNIMKNYKDNGNSVLLCRNVLPYLESSDISSVAYYANENLKPGSLFVIGDYDASTQIRDYLSYYNFEEIMHNVFRKSEHPRFNYIM